MGMFGLIGAIAGKNNHANLAGVIVARIADRALSSVEISRSSESGELDCFYCVRRNEPGPSCRKHNARKPSHFGSKMKAGSVNGSLIGVGSIGSTNDGKATLCRLFDG